MRMKAANALHFNKEEKFEGNLKTDETKNDGMDERKAIDGNLAMQP